MRTVADEDTEFDDSYLPDLMRCVVAGVSVDEGDLSVGSGVLVKAGGRHLVAAGPNGSVSVAVTRSKL